MSNWQEIKTLQDVAKAQADGWEIEVRSFGNPQWQLWNGFAWKCDLIYRARPRQPKMKQITSRCWYKPEYNLIWGEADYTETGWIHVPELDIIFEVPE